MVVAIDEVTVLTASMERQQAGEGKEFLHLLRRLRQDNQGTVSVVLLGSIGFHHVTPDALSTANDLGTVPVRQISIADAAYLAQCLRLGEGVNTHDPIGVSDAIAFSSEQRPCYVHHLVRSPACQVELRPAVRSKSA